MSDSSDDALRHWLERRATDWQALDERLHQRGRHTPRTTIQLAQGLQNVGRDLSLARGTRNERLVGYLQGLYLRLHASVYRPPRAVLRQTGAMLIHDLPATVHAMRRRILAVVVLFLACAAIGTALVTAFPELASLFASEKMITQVQQGHLWTDGILNVMPSSVMALRIMTNNIVVATSAFLLGTLYGLGTVYMVGLNGLMLGGAFALTARHGLAPQLAEFIVAHGIVELSVVCLAGAAGVGLGEALMRPGSQPRARAFQAAARAGARILLVSALFLVGAGLIEGYISPDAGFGWLSRATIGVSYFVIFVWVLTGGPRRLARARYSDHAGLRSDHGAAADHTSPESAGAVDPAHR